MEQSETSKDITVEEVKRLYRNPRQAGSLGGVRKFFEALRRQGKKVSYKTVQQWLQEEDLYQLHKPKKIKFPRRPFIVQGMDHLWQADLSDLSSLKKYNDGFRFLLCIIDCFSKFAWVTAVKDKTARTLQRAVKEILDSTPRKPLFIQTDKGSEFTNKAVRNLLKERHIKFYTSQNEETKAAIVERFQRTYKAKMFRHFTARNTLRYLDVLDDITASYNDTYHTSIGMPPSDVNKQNEAAVRRFLSESWKREKEKSRKAGKLKEGDQVRLVGPKRAFDKGYLPQWTEEIFKVHEILPTRPTTIRIADLNGEVLVGTFYLQELQKVPEHEDRIFLVEKILKKRGSGKKAEVYVKWLGYPKEFNSWILEEDVNDV